MSIFVSFYKTWTILPTNPVFQHHYCLALCDALKAIIFCHAVFSCFKKSTIDMSALASLEYNWSKARRKYSIFDSFICRVPSIQFERAKKSKTIDTHSYKHCAGNTKSIDTCTYTCVGARSLTLNHILLTGRMIASSCALSIRVTAHSSKYNK